VPTATEAPRINSCTSGWQRELPLHSDDSNSADNSMYDTTSSTAAGAAAGVRAVNTLSTTRRTQQQMRCRIEYETGELVLFTAATADTLPEVTVNTSSRTAAAASSSSDRHLQQQQQQQQQQQHSLSMTQRSAVTSTQAATATATADGCSRSSSDAQQPQEMYGVVLDKPLKNHGEWGHADRRGGTDEHYYRLQVSMLCNTTLRSQCNTACVCDVCSMYTKYCTCSIVCMLQE
jgi:hypothetical protein